MISERTKHLRAKIDKEIYKIKAIREVIIGLYNEIGEERKKEK